MVRFRKLQENITNVRSCFNWKSYARKEKQINNKTKNKNKNRHKISCLPPVFNSIFINLECIRHGLSNACTGTGVILII